MSVSERGGAPDAISTWVELEYEAEAEGWQASELKKGTAHGGFLPYLVGRGELWMCLNQA